MGQGERDIIEYERQRADRAEERLEKIRAAVIDSYVDGLTREVPADPWERVDALVDQMSSFRKAVCDALDDDEALFAEIMTAFLGWADE